MFTQQSFFGTVQNVQTCPDCNGTGKVVKDKCPDCRGTGYIPMKKRYAVDIPAGIDNGQSTRMPGLGEPGVNGGPRGDVLVEVIVGRHPIFQRQDFDIFSTVPISFAVAALGGEVLIDTVDGKVVYDVKAGTQTDTKIRLRGKGVPSWRNKDVRGDHYVTLVVQVPTNLNEEAKEALRKFDEACGNRPAGGTSDGSEKSEKKKKSFMGEFKTFIARGNVMDMAVGVIIGGAFGKISTSLVNDVIMPLISVLTGGVDFSNWKIVLKAAVAGADGVIDPATEVAIKYGSFLATILDFLIIAFAVFLMIKTINGFHGKLKKQEETPAKEPAPPEPSNEEKLLTEIRDLLKEK